MRVHERRCIAIFSCQARPPARVSRQTGVGCSAGTDHELLRWGTGKAAGPPVPANSHAHRLGSEGAVSTVTSSVIKRSNVPTHALGQGSAYSRRETLSLSAARPCGGRGTGVGGV